MGAGNGLARIGSGLKWMYVVSRSALALRVQAEVRFRISSRGLFERTRAKEMCVSRWEESSCNCIIPFKFYHG